VAPLMNKARDAPKSIGRLSIMTDEDKPDVCITLLHGTWGRGFFQNHRVAKGAQKRWFEEGSLFRHRLTSKLTDFQISHRIDVHTWSGANSILERAEQAAKLSEQLQDSIAKYPDAKQVVIAHSHGGNVIRLALTRLPDPHLVFVITMATPFIEILASDHFRGHTDTIDNMIRASYFAAALQLPFLLWHTFGYSMKTVALAIAIGLPCAFVLWHFTVHVLLINIDKSMRLRRATHDCMDWNDINLLVIRAIDDEASLSLAAGAIGNRISIALARSMLSLNRSKTVLLTVAAAGIASLVVLWLYSGFDQIRNIDGGWFVLGYLPYCIMVIGSLTAGVFKSVYGRELVFGTITHEVNSQSTPDAGPSMKVVTVSGPPEGREEIHRSNEAWWEELMEHGRWLSPQRSSGRLRHSIYDHEDTIVAIVDGIRDWSARPRPQEVPAAGTSMVESSVQMEREARMNLDTVIKHRREARKSRLR
jgi:Putative serine esterase (DUF676)